MQYRTVSLVVLPGAVALFAACDRTSPTDSAAASSAGLTTSSKPTGSGAAAPAQVGVVRASGSSALQPLVNAAKEKFEAANPGASIEVSAGGSKKGLADVASGAVHIGNSDIFAPADLKARLVDHKVAVIGFAAMANKGSFNEKIAALSLAQLSKIFKGQVKNWKEVGGTEQPIVVINRAAGSGTRTVFGNTVLGGDDFVESQTEDNSGALVLKLKQTRGAISYLALSFQEPELKTFALEVDGKAVEPNAATITSGAYPVWSYEHMYTAGEPTGLTGRFLSYVLSADFQKNVLPAVKGFIPVVDMRVSRDKD